MATSTIRIMVTLQATSVIHSTGSGANLRILLLLITSTKTNKKHCNLTVMVDEWVAKRVLVVKVFVTFGNNITFVAPFRVNIGLFRSSNFMLQLEFTKSLW